MTLGMGPEQSVEQRLEQLLQPQSWIELNPSLNVANFQLMQSVDVLEMDEAAAKSLEEWLLQEGYFHVPQVAWKLPIDGMAQAIVRLVENGWVPPFCYMYDEFWLLFFRLNTLLARLLGQ